jgi:hypothetical protein
VDVFDFAIVKEPKPFESYRPGQRRINASRTGKKFVRVLLDVLEFKAKITVGFPQPSDSGKTLTDMIAFADAHKAQSFLYMPYTGPSLRHESTEITATASQKEFAFLHKHLNAASVRVFKNGVEQTSGWAFSGNDTAPIITFTVAPGVSTIRIEADFYVPCLFRKTPLDDGQGLTDGKDPTVDSPQSFPFELIETEPGARWVNPTGMSGA